MKPFGKILEETTIESSADYKETIEKLMLQRGPCNTKKSFGVQQYFDCTPKGEIRFTYATGKFGYTMYDVEGRVEEQDGKTIIKIYTLQRQSKILKRYGSIILAILLIAIEALYIIKFKESLLKQDGIWTALIMLPIGVIMSFRAIKYADKTKEYRIGVLKNEIVKRVEAIKRWED